MAVYTIQDTTLTDIADAIREKNGKALEVEYPMKNSVASDISFNIIKGNSYRITIIPTELKKDGYGRLETTWVDKDSGITYVGYFGSTETKYVVGEPTEFIFTSSENGTIIKIVNVSTVSGSRIVSATLKLAEVKEDGTLKNKYKPTEMADAISELITISPDKKVFTGDISNGFRAKCFNWFWEDGSVSTKDLTGANSCFHNQYLVKNIPIVFNFKSVSDADISNMFYGCNELRELPRINNVKPENLQSIFYSCRNLHEIPEDYMDTWDMSNIQTDQYGYLKSMFQYCNRLRTIPTKILSKLWGPMGYYNSFFYQAFYECVSLDEVIGIEVGTGNFSSNAFSSCLYSNYHLKDFIFATNDDGSVKTAKWKSQTINFTNGTIGYGPLGGYDFAEETRIVDDESYQLLKDNPDAWTSLEEYSRYNHDSAVRTINSLPDTSAYGTNTIKFKGAAGSKTDGGAINTLTEEEIAVATAKGWTVSLI